MALVIVGQSTCSVCSEILEESQPLATFPAIPFEPGSELSEFSDSAMHQTCFDSWSLREAFVDEFNRYFESHYRGLRRMRADGAIVDWDGA